ncbi:hypothetical protein G7046_g4566 [Stylonectria norvegica]|nr:hypothetical protein G7046_g4566 [Stylonectria norvegica]
MSVMMRRTHGGGGAYLVTKTAHASTAGLLHNIEAMKSQVKLMWDLVLAAPECRAVPRQTWQVVVELHPSSIGGVAGVVEADCGAGSGEVVAAVDGGEDAVGDEAADAGVAVGVGAVVVGAAAVDVVVAVGVAAAGENEAVDAVAVAMGVEVGAAGKLGAWRAWTPDIPTASAGAGRFGGRQSSWRRGRRRRWWWSDTSATAAASAVSVSVPAARWEWMLARLAATGV